jgi:hypothetical protein
MLGKTTGGKPLKTLEELRTLLKFNVINEEEFKAQGGYHDSFSLTGTKEKIEIKIEKYIGESLEAMNELERVFSEEEKTVLIESGTGSGKTRAICEVAINTGLFVVVVVPNIMTADVMSNQLNSRYENISTACHGDNRICNIIGNVTKDKQIIFTTVDQLKNLGGISERELKRRILIIDEAHYYFKVVGFRYEATTSLEEIIKNKVFKKMIFVTATPSVFEIYGKEEKTIKFIQKEYPIKYNLFRIYMKVAMENRKDSIREFINEASEDGLTVVYLNKSKQDQLIHSTICGGEDKGHFVVNADLKNTPMYKYLRDNHSIPSGTKVLYVTDLFTAGTSFSNDNVKNIIFVGETSKDTVKQFSARFRTSNNINIFVIDTFVNSGQSQDTFISDLNERIIEEQEALQSNDFNTDTSHRKGLINGLFYEIKGNIKVSELAKTNLIYENLLKSSKQFCFDNFLEAEMNMPIKTIKLEDAETLLYSAMKESLEIQEEKIMEALEVKVIETLDKRLEQLLTSTHSFNKVANEEGFNKDEKKILLKVVNVIKNTDLMSDDYYRDIFEIVHDKDKETEYRYRLIADSVKDTGVITDNMLFHISKQKKGYTFDKEDLDDKNKHLWRKCIIMAEAIFYLMEGKIGKRKVYTVVRKKDNMREVFGRKIQDEMRKYYLGKLRIKED